MNILKFKNNIMNIFNNLKGFLFKMENSFVVLLITLSTCIIYNSLLNICYSNFKSVDTNMNNYIQIGSLERNKFKDVSMYAYVASGPEFTFGVELPIPDTKAYDWLQSLSSYPYHNWSKNRRQEIISMIKQNSKLELRPNANFALKSDKNYFRHNKIAFSPSATGQFLKNKSLHLFVALCNNAHIINNPKKIHISNEKNVNVEAIVNFKGDDTGRLWRTYYKGNANFDTRYYVTTAYTYDKKSNTYFERTRGKWYFYNDADLIIVDLGTTGDLEDKGESWVLSPRLGVKKYWLYNEMKDPYSNTDNEASIIKANYTVIFTPSWDKSKILKQSIKLGFN